MEDFKKKIDSNPIIIGDFNTHCQQWIVIPSKKIKKDIVTLNDTLDQLDIIDIYRAFHPEGAKYTFFSLMDDFLDTPHSRTQNQP